MMIYKTPKAQTRAWGKLEKAKAVPAVIPSSKSL
jgi:hypothetical protein